MKTRILKNRTCVLRGPGDMHAYAKTRGLRNHVWPHFQRLLFMVSSKSPLAPPAVCTSGPGHTQKRFAPQGRHMRPALEELRGFHREL